MGRFIVCDIPWALGLNPGGGQVPLGMASRGRRGVPAREGEQRRDEPRREDQGEQQAPAPRLLCFPHRHQ
ncbi:hypothetical protein Taro_031089 [Colocasia esculenta]|uniref:Uncharacterized protein n=1 Tax=Colocasia esculenta TaxID=4460 RepID=A0A843VN18_COLES|nr:hypothetical protein [Colocasia esculenta]